VRLRMIGAVPLLPPYAFMACTGTTLPFSCHVIFGQLSCDLFYVKLWFLSLELKGNDETLKLSLGVSSCSVCCTVCSCVYVVQSSMLYFSSMYVGLNVKKGPRFWFSNAVFLKLSGSADPVNQPNSVDTLPQDYWYR
jgi:hypothetical protein